MREGLFRYGYRDASVGETIGYPGPDNWNPGILRAYFVGHKEVSVTRLRKMIVEEEPESGPVRVFLRPARGGGNFGGAYCFPHPFIVRSSGESYTGDSRCADFSSRA